MTLENRLQEILSKYNLLDSKFYQAWSAGTLPVAALKDYASQYGAFISCVPGGWAAHGDEAIAAEEEEHIGLWEQFAEGLGTTIGAPKNESVRKLVTSSKALMADSVTSLGALYAFEAQQPKTALSKLEGLKAHYDLPKSAEVYFEVHAHDEEEPALLLERMKALPAEAQDRAATACETIAAELRASLDALYEDHCGSCTVM